jgi:nucleoside-diphosphate-sugar epimerase
MNNLNSKQIFVLDSMIKQTVTEIDFSPYQNTSVLISGASGHLGLWLTLLFAQESASNKNLKITIESSRHEQVTNLIAQLKLKNVEIFNETKKEKFDVIFDMSLPITQKNDNENYKIVYEFLDKFVVQKKRTQKNGTLVIPSSGAVYGSNKKPGYGFVESDAENTTGVTIYGKAKLLIEELSKEVSDVSIPIFRVFSVFGPLMRKDSPLIGNNFFVQCQVNQLIKLNGKGLSQRNMTLVTDIAKQIIGLARIKGISTSPINLGSQNNLSIRKFADLVAGEMVADVLLGHTVEPVDDYIPALSKLSEYKTTSCMDINEAIQLTGHFYR